MENLANKGKKWSIEEVSKLKRLVSEKKTYAKIALEHQRTIVAVKARVVTEIIRPLIDSGMTIEEAEELYDINRDDINRYLSKCEKHNRNKDIIESIEKKIENVEKKIDSIITIINEFQK